MKTVIIPVFHGQIARNLFLTDVFPTISSRMDTRFVIVTHDFKKDYYQKNYSAENIIIEGIKIGEIEIPAIEKFFRFVFSTFVTGKKPVLIFKEVLDKNHNYFEYFTKRVLKEFFSRSKLLRNLFRWLYYRLVPRKKVFVKLFDKYQPSAVILPDMNFTIDNYILKEAKFRRLPSIGMLRSFDVLNSVKGIVRIFPDKLVVHNQPLADKAAKIGDINPNDISIGGMPHFDIYRNSLASDKLSFAKKIGLDPNKKTILYFLNGLWSDKIDQDIISIISKAIDGGRIPSQTQILASINPNLSQKSLSKDHNLVTLRMSGIHFEDGRSADMEYTHEFIHDLYDSIWFSDVTINSASTTSIDAAALDKPVINIAFDGYQTLPYIQSIARVYEFEHYSPLLRFGGIKLARKESELIDFIKSYLNNPSLDSNGRKKIVEEMCPFIGESGKITGRYLLEFIDKI